VPTILYLLCSETNWPTKDDLYSRNISSIVAANTPSALKRSVRSDLTFHLSSPGLLKPGHHRPIRRAAFLSFTCQVYRISCGLSSGTAR